MVALVSGRFGPSSIRYCRDGYFVAFDGSSRVVCLSLGGSEGSGRCFVCNRSRAICTSLRFRLLILRVVSFVTGGVNAYFFVSSTANFVRRGSGRGLTRCVRGFGLWFHVWVTPADRGVATSPFE